MATIRDLLKKSKEKITTGSKDTYNKVLDTEVDDIKNVSKKISKGFFGLLINFYSVILYFILVGLFIYMGVFVYVLFS